MSMLVVGGWGPRRRRERTRVLDRGRELFWPVRVGAARPRGKRGSMSVSLFFKKLVFHFLFAALALLAQSLTNSVLQFCLPRATVFVSDEKTIPKDEKTGEPLEVRLQASSLFRPGVFRLPTSWTDRSFLSCAPYTLPAQNSASCALTSLKPSSDSRGCRATVCTTKNASSRTGRTRAVRRRMSRRHGLSGMCCRRLLTISLNQHQSSARRIANSTRPPRCRCGPSEKSRIRATSSLFSSLSFPSLPCLSVAYMIM